MCGIVGVYTPDKTLTGLHKLATDMADAIAHRGPDGSGVWVDEDAGIALSHRRLSIIDTSTAGAQPMMSNCGQFVLTYNGELYNAPEMKRSLGEHAYRGHSDTEILLEWFARRGVDETLKNACGMFALALWDRKRRCLYVIRDRLGIKPLYIAHFAGGVAFASEVRALLALPGVSRKLNPRATYAFLQHGCVPGELCIFEGMQKLLPGHIAEFRSSREPAIRQWWSALEHAAAEPSFNGGMDAAVDRLDTLL